MKTADLYLEYAQIINLCKGTALEDTPWVCVRRTSAPAIYTTHPIFSEKSTYEFAIAILEEKPVFVGDVLYDKRDKYDRQMVVTGINIHGLTIKYSKVEWINWIENASWTPPEQKRTFTLNGLELPCPVNDPVDGLMFNIHGNSFYFKTMRDRDSIIREFSRILTEARDKS